MTLLQQLSAFGCVGACAVVVSMEWGWGTPSQRAVGKGLASLAMVVFALVSGASASVAGILICMGLVLSGVGDVLLAQGDAGFVKGLGAFLLAHVFYTTSFVWSGIGWAGVGFAAGIVAPIALVVWRRYSLVAGPLRRPVAAYLLVISCMLMAAVGACWLTPNSSRQLLVVSVVGFGVSDLFVAQDRLVERKRINVLVGLPLYYVSQLGIGLAAVGL